MNISQKCNCCAKEEVCKFTEEYQADCKRLVQNISGRSTEINIKCKYFSNKSTSITRNLENERLKKKLEEGYTAKEVDEIANSKVRITRKETAEKFAERLKAKLCEFFDDNEDNDGKISKGICLIEVIGVVSMDGEVISLGLIDEIAKEITEGGNNCSK